MARIIGKEEFQQYEPATQVYRATHEGIGKRLSLRNRSFISFSYGGRLIEDFGLIAYTEGDSLNRPAYANFEDITETYDAIDGQIYWGTHFTNNELTLNLVTDGIDERELDEFKAWFTPGVAKELVLAEHPNRAIMARVSAPPSMSLMPFEKSVSKMLAGVERKTSITLYKGKIELTFISDDPFWYSRYNLFVPAMYGEGIYGVIDIHQDPYKLKMLLDGLGEGGRNLIVKFKTTDSSGVERTGEEYLRLDNNNPMVISNGYWYLQGTRWYATSDGTTTSGPIAFTYPSEVTVSGKVVGGCITGLGSRAITWSDNNDDSSADEGRDYIKMIIEDNIPHIRMFQNFNCLLGQDLGVMAESGLEESKIFNPYPSTVNNLMQRRGAHITYYGWINYNYESLATSLNIPENGKQYLYYAGNAPSKPRLQFDFIPKFGDDIPGTFNKYYIVNPINKYSPGFNALSEYNYVAIDDNKFYFTIPSLISGYNQAINLAEKLKVGDSATEFLTQLREKINEYYSRSYAIYVYETVKTARATTGENTNFFVINGVIQDGFKEEFCLRMTRMLLVYNFRDNDHINTTPPAVTATFDSKTGEATCKFIINHPDSLDVNTRKMEVVENTGDMVKSPYLILDGRNYPNANGYITAKECHYITTNYPNGLQNFAITYKNMYY